jgi:hypothetical protein
MATKTNFTPDEWKLVMQSPMMASIAVSAAEPSGIFGTLREGMASARSLMKAKTDPSADELIKAVADDIGTSDGRSAVQDGVKATLAGAKPGDFKAKAVDELRQVSALLDRKAPADAVAFKTWLNQTAQSVAAAAAEGGFLGFGGHPISEIEKATLAEIAAALNVPATGPGA